MPETRHSFFLHPTEPEEVASIIHRLKDTAAGMDHITATVLKAAANAISTQLSSIINTSFSNGIFLNALKRAVVSPIHKAKSRKLMSNYRPVSVLPAISKIFEKLFHQRIYKYQLDQDLRYKMQFGFRPSYCTEHALLAFKKRIIDAFESKKVLLAVLMDLP